MNYYSWYLIWWDARHVITELSQPIINPIINDERAVGLKVAVCVKREGGQRPKAASQLDYIPQSLHAIDDRYLSLTPTEGKKQAEITSQWQEYDGDPASLSARILVFKRINLSKGEVGSRRNSPPQIWLGCLVVELVFNERLLSLYQSYTLPPPPRPLGKTFLFSYQLNSSLLVRVNLCSLLSALFCSLQAKLLFWNLMISFLGTPSPFLPPPHTVYILSTNKQRERGRGGGLFFFGPDWEKNIISFPLLIINKNLFEIEIYISLLNKETLAVKKKFFFFLFLYKN